MITMDAPYKQAVQPVAVEAYTADEQPAAPILTVVAPKPLPVESLKKDFGIAYSLVTSTKVTEEDLDKKLSPNQMSLRELRDQMGIRFQLV